MADKELAMQLAKRLHKLSLDMGDNGAGRSQVPQGTIISELSPPPPPPPPPPSQKPQTPPYQSIPDNEWTDMDKLIGQTLHNVEVSSRNTPNNALTSMDYAPKPFRKPPISVNVADTSLQVQEMSHPDTSERSDSFPLLPKCTAPIVPIIHHKSAYHEQSRKFPYDDLALQKERDELEAKLAKQRQKKSVAEAETATPFALVGINANEESVVALEMDKSQLTPLTNQIPPPVLPKTASIDLSSIEMQWKDTRKPVPISKDSTSFVSAVNLDQFSKWLLQC
uniref:RPAP1_N domain-containing protein n=1 Tax=Elaeophora elaphi TaxID=1147741 RepID=A0A0R3RFT2_9BILA